MVDSFWATDDWEIVATYTPLIVLQTDRKSVGLCIVDAEHLDVHSIENGVLVEHTWTDKRKFGVLFERVQPRMVCSSHGIPDMVIPAVIVVARVKLHRGLLFRFPQSSGLSNLILDICQTVNMSVVIFQFHIVRDIRNHSFRVLMMLMLFIIMHFRPINWLIQNRATFDLLVLHVRIRLKRVFKSCIGILQPLWLLFSLAITTELGLVISCAGFDSGADLRGLLLVSVRNNLLDSLTDTCHFGLFVLGLLGNRVNIWHRISDLQVQVLYRLYLAINPSTTFLASDPK